MKITSLIILVIIMVLIGVAALSIYALRAMTQTPEEFLPLPPRLAKEEIQVIETYLGVRFPDNTKKIYAYYDSFDRYHLHVGVEIEGDVSVFMKDRNWTKFDLLSETEKDLYVWPVKRYYVNRLSHGGGEILSWWQPDRNRVKWYCKESECDKNTDETITDTTLLLEKGVDNWKAYIIKSRWPDSPKQIESVFPENKVNWYLRESALYPIK